MFSLRIALVIIIALAALPGLALTLDSALQARAEAVRHATGKAELLLTAASADYEALFEGAGRLLARIATVTNLVPGRPADLCDRELADYLHLHPHYTNLGISDLEGRVFCSARPLPAPVNIADRSYFQRALVSGQLAAGDYQIGRITGVPAVNIGIPVRAPDGTPQGVLYAALGLEWLEQRVASTELPPGASITVLDALGNTLARFPSTDKRPGEDPATRDTEALTLSAVSRELANGALELRVTIPEHALFGEINERFARQIQVIALVSLLILVGGYYGGRLLILRRVDGLVNAAEALGRGDLATRSGIGYARDEIGRLAHSFDSMAENVERQQRRIARANRALKTLSAGNRALLRAADESTLLEAICTAVVEEGGYAAAWVGYRKEDVSDTLRPMASAGGDVIPGINRLPPQVAAAGLAPLLVRPSVDADCCPEFAADLQQGGYVSVLLLPLRIDGATIGALSVYSTEAEAFDPDEQALLAETADDLAFGIDLYRQRQRHRKAEATINRLSRYEQLTGLPNREYFRKSLEDTLSAETGADQAAAVLLVDIDRFREINTALGYDHGDGVLREVAARLLGQVTGGSFLAHMGEDEFAVLVPDSGRDQAAAMAERLGRALEAPIRIGELSLDVAVSVGIALYPQHGTAPDLLVRRADSAMYKAKRAGRDYEFYSPAHDETTPRHLTLAADLRQAIERGELSLACQPKLRLDSGIICGVEALARWTHPVSGEISPAEFIPLAEHTGLIKPLTQWVLEEALRHARTWRRQGLDLPLAVNLSARNLQEPGIVENLQRALDSSGVAADQLAIELTESAFMVDPDGALQVMQRLHEMGIVLFIDDFGTGYSSLAYLQRLPVDAIKIDKSFVLAMIDDKDSARIVESTIELAHGLGMEVVAEGVENGRILQALTDLGCDCAQGYGIGYPLPAADIKTWIEQSPWLAAEIEA